jgi:hypothetical protein
MAKMMKPTRPTMMMPKDRSIGHRAFFGLGNTTTLPGTRGGTTPAAWLASRLERNDVVFGVQNMILALRCKLLAFPSRTAHSVLGKEDLKEVIAILSSAMEECFGNLREIDLDAVVERNKKQGRYQS